MNNQDTFEIHWLFSVIRQWLWLIISCALLAGITAWIVSRNIDPAYKASATLYIEPSKDSMTSEYNALMAAERLALTYSEMLTDRPVLEKVISELDLKITPEQLAKKITSKTISDTQLITIIVEDTSPQQAAGIANLLATTFSDHISAMESGRYLPKIKEYQTQILELDVKIASNQDLIDQLQATLISEQNQLALLQSTLLNTQNNKKILEQNYQDLQLAIAQAKKNIIMFESAQLPDQTFTPPFKATVLLLVSQNITGSAGDYSSILASERLTETYAEMLMSRSVLAEAITRVDPSLNVNRIVTQVSAEPIENTQLIQLDVEDNDPNLATNLANKIAEVFIEGIQTSQIGHYLTQQEDFESEINELEIDEASIKNQIDDHSEAVVYAETQIKRYETIIGEDKDHLQDLKEDKGNLEQLNRNATDNIYITESAEIPQSTSSNSLLYIGLAIIVGGIIGGGCAFLLEYLDDTIKTAEDITNQLGLNILGKIGTFTNKEGQLIVISDPRSPVAEAFRVLASNINFAAMDKPIKSLIITSPSSREGKSAILANLAVTLARTEASVVAIDADLRIPTLHKLFDVRQSDGLTGALLTGNLNGKLQNGVAKGLKILTSGNLPPNPAEILGSARMRKIISDLNQYITFVLIDCPPVLPVADAAILASLTDGAILVVRSNKTRIRAAREAIQSLQQSGVKIIGAVLNDVPTRASGYYSYAYTKQDGSEEGLSKNWWAKLRARFKPKPQDE